MSYAVRYTAAARADLLRLYDDLLDRATSTEDLRLAERAASEIESAIEGLARSPFICRKGGADPFLRELLIAFSSSGDVALFEIEDGSTVTVLAARHQREDDYRCHRFAPGAATARPAPDSAPTPAPPAPSPRTRRSRCCAGPRARSGRAG